MTEALHPRLYWKELCRDRMNRVQVPYPDWLLSVGVSESDQSTWFWLDQAEAVSSEIIEAYRNAAKELYQEDGSTEIDDGATVSISEDGGAYVQAWIWVHDEDAGVCTNCRSELTDNGEGFDGLCGNCADAQEPEDEGDEVEPWKPQSNWDDHPEHTAVEWQLEVENGDTRQSYVEWVNSKLQEASE